MLAAFVSVAGACLLAVFLLARRVDRLATTQARLVTAQRADRTTQAALGRALQTLHKELSSMPAQLAARGEMRDALSRIDALTDAHRALERRWGLEHARSLARDGIAPELLIKEYGLTPAEARLITRLEPSANGPH
ncbi:hypothetical protein [uncultured Abyssibacter sp.]|uniref:hypothetical protein n=1 Tax=uncultured Abyssibacter sp. TaxID=2320202 RepID=UPI0032B200D4